MLMLSANRDSFRGGSASLGPSLASPEERALVAAVLGCGSTQKVCIG